MQIISVALKQGTLTNEGGVLTGSASTLNLSMWETKVCTIQDCQKELALNSNQKELEGFKNYFSYKKQIQETLLLPFFQPTEEGTRK